MLEALGPAQESAQVNPSLARKVFASRDKNVFLLPGAGNLCLLATSADLGQSVSCTTTDLAAANGLGFVSSSSSPSGGPSEVTFGGVFPDGARDVTIVDAAGTSFDVPLNANNVYWVTVKDPVDMTWTTASGEVRQTAFGQYKLFKVLSGQ